jgi:hypothetical protein
VLNLIVDDADEGKSEEELNGEKLEKYFKNLH